MYVPAGQPVSTLCVRDSAAATCEMLVFIGPDLWLPNSPDLNPVDNFMLNVIWNRMCQTHKQHLVNAGVGLQQCIVDKAVDTCQ